MDRYEYKVVPAPEKGLKAKGIKAPADRFAHAVEQAMNQLGADGWEYWRAECLPSTERAGLTGSKITERHLLVFRRAIRETPAITPRRVVQDPTPTADEPEPETPPETDADRTRTPVFTRRLEIMREQRQEVLEQDEGIPEPRPDQDPQSS